MGRGTRKDDDQRASAASVRDSLRRPGATPWWQAGSGGELERLAEARYQPLDAALRELPGEFERVGPVDCRAVLIEPLRHALTIDVLGARERILSAFDVPGVPVDVDPVEETVEFASRRLANGISKGRPLTRERALSLLGEGAEDAIALGVLSSLRGAADGELLQYAARFATIGSGIDLTQGRWTDAVFSVGRDDLHPLARAALNHAPHQTLREIFCAALRDSHQRITATRPRRR